MASFLKVFQRKKDEKNTGLRTSTPSLLEGKFEAVTADISPSSAKFPEEAAKAGRKGKEKQKSGKDNLNGLSALLRTKSASSADAATSKPSDTPHLLLNLPGPKDDGSSRALGVVFEADPDSQILLTEAVIGERRLNPLETLILVRACSQVIAARGLETLGIMHPHWYSASPDVQRKLISMFIQSLAPKSPITTLSPTPSAAVAAFESELDFTRSSHDVAAVLRWGLRHLRLEGTSFGKSEDWYKAFFEAEAGSQYPPKAFSEKLIPLIPPSHVELLRATLDIFSSLAAHSEANSISGSKLSMLLGLWILSTRRAEGINSWSSFYEQWERTGRMLEHLFLAYVRNEAASTQMPRRLTELVQHYPYSKEPSSDGLLRRPRSHTHTYDALYVRIRSELPDSGKAPGHQPVKLLQDALRAEVADGSELKGVWESIKTAASTVTPPSSPGGVAPGLNAVFDDETIRFLTLAHESSQKADAQPVFSLAIPERAKNNGTVERARSVSPRRDASSASTPPTAANEIGIDWAQFSTSGFLDSVSVAPLAETLLDKDLEVTVPSRKGSKKLNKGQRNLPKLATNLDGSKEEEVDRSELKSKASETKIVPLDEAFVDFWSDALLDPISKDWPAFIVCRVKPSVPGVEHAGKRIEWVVLEQTFEKPAPPPPVQPVSATAVPLPESPRPTSPRLSMRSASSTSGDKKSRFSLFSSVKSLGKTSKKDRGEKPSPKASKTPKIGEMGEILNEEDEKESVKAGKSNGAVGAGVATAAAALAVGGAAAVAAETAKETPKEDDLLTPTQEKVDALANADPVSQTAPVDDAEPSSAADAALLAEPTLSEPSPAAVEPTVEDSASSEPASKAPGVGLAVPAEGLVPADEEKTPIAEKPTPDLAVPAEPAAEDLAAPVQAPPQEPAAAAVIGEAEETAPPPVPKDEPAPAPPSVPETEPAPPPKPEEELAPPPLPKDEPAPTPVEESTPPVEVPVEEVVEETVVTSPVVAEAVAPVVEQPTAEEPAATSVMEEAAPQESTPAIDEPAVDILAAAEPIVEQPIAEEPAAAVIEEAKTFEEEPDSSKEEPPVKPVAAASEPEVPVVSVPVVDEPAAPEPPADESQHPVVDDTPLQEPEPPVVDDAKPEAQPSASPAEEPEEPIFAVPAAQEPEPPAAEIQHSPEPPVVEQPTADEPVASAVVEEAKTSIPEERDPTAAQEPEPPVVDQPMAEEPAAAVVVDEVKAEESLQEEVPAPVEEPKAVPSLDTPVPEEPAPPKPETPEPVAQVEYSVDSETIPPAVTDEPDTTANEKLTTPHLEPLKTTPDEPEADISLPPVPVVETSPEIKAVAEPSNPDATALPTPPTDSRSDVPDLAAQPGPENVVLSGSTPAPQVALDSVENQMESTGAPLVEDDTKPEKPSNGTHVPPIADVKVETATTQPADESKL